MLPRGRAFLLSALLLVCGGTGGNVRASVFSLDALVVAVATTAATTAAATAAPRKNEAKKIPPSPEDKKAAAGLKKALQGMGVEVPDELTPEQAARQKFYQEALMELDYALLSDGVDNDLRDEAAGRAAGSSSASSSSTSAPEPDLNARGWDRSVDTASCPQPAQCTVARIDARDLEKFQKKFQNMHPVILRGGSVAWPAVSGNASRRWTMRRLRELSKATLAGDMHYGGSDYIVYHGNGKSRSVKMADYLDYMLDLRDWRHRRSNTMSVAADAATAGVRAPPPPMPLSAEQRRPDRMSQAFTREPWYVFHRGIWANKDDPFQQWMQSDCTPIPPSLRATANGTRSTGSGAFLEFIIGLGAPGTGTALHQHGETYVHMIEGSKRVLMYPPWKMPPTLPVVNLEQQATHPEWTKRIHGLHPGGAWSQPGLRVEAEECTIHRGDVLYIPDGWLHGTTNCAESAAVALQPSTQNPIGELYYPLMREGVDVSDHQTFPGLGYVKTMQGNSVKAVRARQYRARFIKRALRLQPYAPEPYILLSRLYFRGNTLKANKVAFKHAKLALELASESISAQLAHVKAIAQRIQLLSSPNVSRGDGGFLSSEDIPADEERDAETGAISPAKLRERLQSRQREIVVTMKAWVAAMEDCMKVHAIAHPGWVREGGAEGPARRKAALSPNFDGMEKVPLALHASWAQVDVAILRSIVKLVEEMMPTVLLYGMDFMFDLGADIPAAWAKRVFVRRQIGKLVMMLHAEVCDWEEEFRLNPFDPKQGDENTFVLNWDGFMEMGTRMPGEGGASSEDDEHGGGAKAKRTKASDVFSAPLAYQYWSNADTPVVRHAKNILGLLENMDGSNEVSLAWPVACNGEEEVRSLEWLSKNPRVYR